MDPLDGTKEFIKRNGQFTVNIALIRGDAPVLGVVHVPVRGSTYWAVTGSGENLIVFISFFMHWHFPSCAGNELLSMIAIVYHNIAHAVLAC